MEGRLYRYRTSPGSLQAFESPVVHDFKNFVVYLGGLTDGLLACPYVEALGAACHKRGWALVQPVLSSSYAGYGTGSLDRDTQELTELLDYLAAERGLERAALCGHSTGCQNAVHFLRHAPPHARLRVVAAALQAPVSDREAAAAGPDAAACAALLAKADQLVARGDGSEVCGLQYGFVPLVASRAASLYGRGGPDDLFSSDFSDDELIARLGHMSGGGQRALPGTAAHPGLQTLVAFSMGDEYVPTSVNRPLLVQRLAAALSHRGEPADAVALPLAAANHNLSAPPDAAGLFVAAVGDLLADAAAS